MTRVLYLCHGHPALVPGGTETVAHDLFRSVREQPGCDAMFVGCVSPLHREGRADSRLQTIGRTADELLLWVGAFDRFNVAQTETRGFALAMGELLASFRPEIVHFHHLSRLGLEAILLTRRVLPRAKIVLTLHDYFAICANDGLMTFGGSGRRCREATPDSCHACMPEVAQHRFLARTLHLQTMLRQVDRFIAPSAFLRDRYVDWGLPAAKIDIVANGVPADDPAPAAPRRSRRTFGFFGNIAPHKGVLVALAALAHLAQEQADVRLHLHGGLNFQPEPFRHAFDEAVAAVRTGGALPRCLPPVGTAGPDGGRGLGGGALGLVGERPARHSRSLPAPPAGDLLRYRRHGGNGAGRDQRPALPGGDDAHDLARVMHRAVRQRGLWRRLVDGLPAPSTVAEATDRHLALYQSLSRHEEALSA